MSPVEPGRGLSHDLGDEDCKAATEANVINDAARCLVCRPMTAARVLTCAEGCVLPDDERLFDIGEEKFHAVMVRPGVAMSYFGPQPPEYEPCGPVTTPASPPSP